MYFGSVTNRDSNHLPHDSHFDVLLTTLRMGYLTKGKMIYEGYGDHKGCTGHTLVPFYFPTNG